MAMVNQIKSQVLISIDYRPVLVNDKSNLAKELRILYSSQKRSFKIHVRIEHMVAMVAGKRTPGVLMREILEAVRLGLELG